MSIEPSKTFESRFQNRLADLNRAIAEAVRFIEESGVTGGAVHIANLAIEEMATNILKYGYDDTLVHEILLRVEILPEKLHLTLEDDGHEFNPLKVPEKVVDLPAEMRVPGGLGIHLVRKFVEEMRYERRDGRNRLTIVVQH